MPASSNAKAFVENFVDQWLDLRQIDFALPDRKLHPEYDDYARKRQWSAHAFFAQLLQMNASVNNFIHSDFLMLNRCIAKHYEIEGVTGEEFGAAPLAAGSHRGGTLTQASVLKVSTTGYVLVAGAPWSLGNASAARRST